MDKHLKQDLLVFVKKVSTHYKIHVSIMYIREIPVHQNQFGFNLYQLGLQVLPENTFLKILKNERANAEMYLSILNEHGKPTIFEDWNADCNEKAIDCSEWPKGAYYMSIRGEDRKLVKMFEIRKN